MLTNILNELRQINMNPLNARLQLDRAKEHALEVAKLIEQQRSAGLAVSPAGQKLDQATATIQKAESTVNSAPLASLVLATSQIDELTALRKFVSNLTQQQKLVASRLTDLQQLQKQLVTQRKSANAIGVDTKPFVKQVKGADARIQQAIELSSTDYSATLSLLDASNKTLSRQASGLKSVADQHYFRTRTLPL